MAKAYYTCPECGENEILVYAGNRRNADNLAAWHEAKGHVCQDCREKKRQQANEAAADANAKAGLPALTGSERQVAWAESIRAQKISYTEQILAGQEAPDGSPAVKNPESPDERILSAVDALKAEQSASWWIDNRDERVVGILADIARAQAAQAPSAPVVEAEAKAEATVRPDSPKTETVAEIRAKKNVVEIAFPEKREDFRELVRYKLGYTWSGSAWHRPLPATAGSPQDRAAEAGHRLLAAGFVIRIFDADVRQAAISGSYKPEQTRWIRALIKGEYAGWFSVSWKKPDDLYHDAKRIPGARWHSPAMAVPAEQFENLQDFAEIHEFSWSDAALDLLEKAKSAHDNAVVARDIEVKERTGKTSAPVVPPKLDIPDDIDVDEALRDD